MSEPADLSRVRTVPLRHRRNKVATNHFAAPAAAGRSFVDFLDSLPRVLGAETLRAVTAATARAHVAGRPVILAMGAHVVKCGLNPVVIDLMRRGIVTAVALNGAGAIHDFETALIGATSEDVEAGLKDGTFGMVRETAAEMNAALNAGRSQADAGMGALLGRRLLAMQAPHRAASILANGVELGVPVTVHVAIGADIIHMHPSADGAATGAATFADFRTFAGVVAELSGGVHINLGSAVLLPEVFLKAFTVAQNLGADLHDFVTINMDMTMHYRPRENVVRRPAAVGGRGYQLTGHHEIMLPLLAHAVIEEIERLRAGPSPTPPGGAP